MKIFISINCTVLKIPILLFLTTPTSVITFFTISKGMKNITIILLKKIPLNFKINRAIHVEILMNVWAEGHNEDSLLPCFGKAE